MRYRVRITRNLRLERHISIAVEADGLLEACALVDDGRIDGPPARDPRWQRTKRLEHEERCPA